MRNRVFGVLIAVAGVFLLGALANPQVAGVRVVSAASPPQGGADALRISVLSSAPPRVTGGDALLEIAVPGPGVKVLVNGQDQTAAFKGEASGPLRGLVTGLKRGDNTVTASVGVAKANLTLTNYPSSGPVFSGPHQTPFVCETHNFKLPDGKTLGPAKDDDCFAPTNVQYLYKPVGQEMLKPLDPNGPRPTDIDQTKTIFGVSAPFIVRLETGVINRAIYQISVLAEPGQKISPAWNGALIYAFGGGCGPAYRQGRAVGGGIDGAEVMNDPYTLGFAIASATLNVLGQNCNDVTSAETAMMVKERFIEEFGPVRHTIGLGGSGGSMQQNLIAENYPGILDGILPQRSFPDIATMVANTVDCPLLGRYFETAYAGWTDGQKAAVTGYPSFQHCQKGWSNYQPRWISPLGTGCDSTAFITPDEGAAAGTRGTGITVALYDPIKSPTGVRCGYYDNTSTVYGLTTDGKARRPLDNVGVQYGLKALNDGTISFDQFLDLNRKIGGVDADGSYTSQRMTGDLEAIRISYATGRINTGTNLNTIPILDVRVYTDLLTNIYDVHMGYTTEMARARWKAKNGSADNFVAWRVDAGGGGLLESMRIRNSPYRQAMRQAMVAMDRWLDNLAKDAAKTPITARIAKSKPAEVFDACFTASMEKIPMRVGDPKGRCATMYPDHADTRIVAGDSLQRVTLKCALQPVNPKLYKMTLTTAQAQALREVFPDGVCDYTKSPLGLTRFAGSWLSYPKPGEFRVSTSS
jgi:uncharacterized tannase-like protein DUF6351